MKTLLSRRRVSCWWRGIVVVCACLIPLQALFSSSPADGDCVVLLHGLGRSRFSMKRLEWLLERRGYQVVNLSYPSTSESIDDLAENWLPRILEQKAPKDRPIHFVTHSLGGIVVRQYLCNHHPKNLGRVVMLGPPNHGSQLVDVFRTWRCFRSYTGLAGQQLGTDQLSFPNRLGPADYELGIIAGDRSLNPILSACLPGPDDGKVTVASTRLEGMKEHLVVHRSHTWLMWRKDVLARVLAFLKEGHF